jgi:hypothetical protein
MALSSTGKKLIFKKAGNPYNINVYTRQADVGPYYVGVRIDGVPYYAQLGIPGSEGTTDLLVEHSDGGVYAVRQTIHDHGMIGRGSIQKGIVAPAPIGITGSYTGSGLNATCVWAKKAQWIEPNDDRLFFSFYVTISPQCDYDLVDHYRLKYGWDSNCTNDAGTIVRSARNWTVTNCPIKNVAGDFAKYYFRVFAEDASNNVVYSTPVYGPVEPAQKTKSAAGVTYHIDYADNLGNNRVRGWDGNAGTTQSSVNETSATTTLFTVNGTTPPGATTSLVTATPTGAIAGQGNATTAPAIPAKRWFYLGTTTAYTTTTENTQRWSMLSCSDTCSCNCNYCTCNCNYCTCNCNYCTCNCNYYPCSCSSCSCGTC